MSRADTVDITPTWGQWGGLYRRLAESGEVRAVVKLRTDFTKAMLFAEALAAIWGTLTPEQMLVVKGICLDAQAAPVADK